MPNNILFCFVFLIQIVLISFYLPRRIAGRMRSVLDKYPPSTYPKLYLKPIEHYERSLLHYKYMNFFILLAGFFMLAMLLADRSNDDWGGVVVVYFLFQFIPMILLEIGSFKYYKLMRKADSRTTRRAELRPRRLFDFVSPTMLGLAVFVYVAFALLVVYVNRFEYPWFGGYTNLAAVTLSNLFLAGIAAWNLYGKKMNPYQAHEDRIRQIELVVKQMVFFSIVMTVYVALEIGLHVLNLLHLRQIALSLYLQLVAVMSFRSIRVDNINFDVYKEDPAIA